MEDDLKRIKEFHTHLNECEQCRNHPFNLCRKGVHLLRYAALGEAWAIYQHPKDYPDKYVVRRWFIADRMPDPIPEQSCLLANSIEGARLLIPPGLIPFNPMAADDPVIVEVWI